MQKIKSRPGLLAYFRACTPDVCWYFQHLPALVDGFPLDVALAYLFARIELAHRLALYCGIAKLHRGDSDLTWKAVRGQHLSRADFRSKFQSVYGKPIPDPVGLLLVQAEAARDDMIHGRTASDDDKRNAIAHGLEYAQQLNTFVPTVGGPPPFKDLRGFKGALQSLDKSTTRWVLKGMGFTL